MLSTTMPLARSLVALPARFGARTFTSATLPRLAASRRPPGSADLHPLPAGAKAASPAPAQSSSSGSNISPSGNSTAPEDLSSRPSGPGPSGPTVDPKVAAPDTVARGEENATNGNGDSNWTTSFSGMSERPFEGKPAEVLGEELNQEDIEIKPGE